MKKLISVILIAILSFCTTACQTQQVWYRSDVDETCVNILSVSKKDKNHLHIKAECINGVNMGVFEEDFLLITDNIAIFSDRNFWENDYTVIARITEEKIIIKVRSSEKISEPKILNFGENVTLSREYTKEKPTFDYTNKVIEKVFLSDMELAHSVEEILGEKEYRDFIKAFGISSEITKTELGNKTIIYGKFEGLDNWCSFCNTSDGFIYGIYDNHYFSNDPIYQNNPPTFMGKVY